MADPFTLGLIFSSIGSGLSSLLQPGQGGQELRSFHQRGIDVPGVAVNLAERIAQEDARAQQRRGVPIHIPGFARETEGLVGAARVPGLPTGLLGMFPGTSAALSPRGFDPFTGQQIIGLGLGGGGAGPTRAPIFPSDIIGDDTGNPPGEDPPGPLPINPGPPFPPGNPPLPGDPGDGGDGSDDAPGEDDPPGPQDPGEVLPPYADVPQPIDPDDIGDKPPGIGDDNVPIGGSMGMGLGLSGQISPQERIQAIDGITGAIAQILQKVSTPTRQV